MDFNLKQWRNLSEEEEQEHEISELGPPSLKIPKLEINYHSQQSTVSSALHLFVPEHSATTNNSPKMGSYFSLAQWQELELQALIYRHMIAGATVPSELLQLVKKSIITSSPYYMSNSIYYPHYQPALVQSGYWGRGAMDPEPGRCRRTDGKKWRCSRDVVTGQKYCERHVHRGRNRSRKPVEIPTSSTITTTSSTQGAVTGGSTSKFTLTGPTPSMDLLHFGQRSSNSIIETKGGPFGTAEDGQHDSGRTLRHFFDDWPRSLHDTDGTTNLSISMPENSSDFSLKLGTGNSAQVARNESERPQLNWGGRWDTHRAAPVGGPLAEALQASMSNASPTSVLRLVPSASTSGASFIGS